MYIKNQIKQLCALCLIFISPCSNAVSVLQLGPDDEASATYNVATETWGYTETESGFSFNAYNLGEDSMKAFLVFASFPESVVDNFEISVKDSMGVNLALYSQGYGTPPFEDPNSLASHGIYDTWSEVYEIVFDDSAVIVPDTQPGEGGFAVGYVETIFVDVLVTEPSLSDIHVDMFTANFDAEKDRNIVTGFAPFSHDGQLILGGSPAPTVPAPAAAWLFGSGLLGLAGIARRKV